MVEPKESMTVRELMTLLSKCDPNEVVWRRDRLDGIANVYTSVRGVTVDIGGVFLE